MNMSSKPRTDESASVEGNHADAAELPAENPARDKEIRRRAYEIYLERGGQAGGDLDDWLQAEHELKTAGTMGSPAATS
jgi:Protein of unknown function (DUF2934)